MESHINKLQAVAIKVKKKCNCCNKKHTLWTHYTVQSGLVWHDCDCKSTLVVEEKK